MTTRLLVTGITGFIGRHLSVELLRRGQRIRAAVRNLHAGSAVDPSIEKVVIGDLAGEINWDAALEGIGTVIHLAGIAHAGPDVPEHRYDRVNRWATARLAQAAFRKGARLIFISSVAAQAGPSASKIITEQDIPVPVSPYGRSKLNAEREIIGTQGRYVILRPTLVYGQGVRGNMKRLLDAALLPIPLPFGAVDNRRSLLAVENLVSAIALILDRTDQVNETFLVSDPAPVSLVDIVTLIRRGAGRGPGLMSIPPGVLSALHKIAGRSDFWERLAGNLVVSTDRLTSIGYRPVTDSVSGLIALGSRNTRRAQARRQLTPNG